MVPQTAEEASLRARIVTLLGMGRTLPLVVAAVTHGVLGGTWDNCRCHGCIHYCEWSETGVTSSWTGSNGMIYCYPGQNGYPWEGGVQCYYSPPPSPNPQPPPPSLPPSTPPMSPPLQPPPMPPTFPPTDEQGPAGNDRHGLCSLPVAPARSRGSVG